MFPQVYQNNITLWCLLIPGPTECLKIWWVQTYVLGIICPPLPIGIGLINLRKYCEDHSSRPHTFRRPLFYRYEFCVGFLPEKNKRFRVKNNDILLPKLFWPTVRKNYSSDREKLLKFEAEGWIIDITRTIYSNSESSEQFMVTECFFIGINSVSGSYLKKIRDLG